MNPRGDYFNLQPGWNTTSHDYHSHVKNMERMQSVLPDVPHYPNVHLIFNNKLMPRPEKQDPQPQSHQVSQKKVQKPESRKKEVRFVEPEKAKVVDKQQDGGDQSIDAYADGFIKNKHKNFELVKWDSFRL